MTNERLAVLARARRLPVFVTTIAVVLVGLFAPGWFGAVILLALAAGLLYLLGLTWRVTPAASLVIRLLILMGLMAIAFAKITS